MWEEEELLRSAVLEAGGGFTDAGAGDGEDGGCPSHAFQWLEMGLNGPFSSQTLNLGLRHIMGRMDDPQANIMCRARMSDPILN